jgi:hypothetical protein
MKLAVFTIELSLYSKKSMLTFSRHLSGEDDNGSDSGLLSEEERAQSSSAEWRIDVKSALPPVWVDNVQEVEVQAASCDDDISHFNFSHLTRHNSNAPPRTGQYPQNPVADATSQSASCAPAYGQF